MGKSLICFSALPPRSPFLRVEPLFLQAINPDRAKNRRALKQPEHARRALEIARTEGVVHTYKRIRGQLSAGLPTGYSAAGTVVSVGVEVDGFAHPLSAVYCRTTLPYIEDLLARDRLRPAFLFDAVRTRRITAAEITSDPDLRTLRNLNTPEDYQRVLADAGVS